MPYSIQLKNINYSLEKGLKSSASKVLLPSSNVPLLMRIKRHFLATSEDRQARRGEWILLCLENSLSTAVSLTEMLSRIVFSKELSRKESVGAFEENCTKA